MPAFSTLHAAPRHFRPINKGFSVFPGQGRRARLARAVRTLLASSDGQKSAKRIIAEDVID
jgi:hypothetical protein